MPDIMTKALWSRDFKQGSVTVFVGVGISGSNVETAAPRFNEVLSSGLTDDKYSARWDDVTYYTA